MKFQWAWLSLGLFSTSFSVAYLGTRHKEHIENGVSGLVVSSVAVIWFCLWLLLVSLIFGCQCALAVPASSFLPFFHRRRQIWERVHFTLVLSNIDSRCCLLSLNATFVSSFTFCIFKILLFPVRRFTLFSISSNELNNQAAYLRS